MESRDTVRHLELAGRSIELHIIRRRRKSLAIHVFPDRPVELRAPLKCSWTLIEEFLQSRLDWVAESLESLAGEHAPVSHRYIDGEAHYFLGQRLPLSLHEGRTRRVSVTDDAIAVRCINPGDANDVKKALDAFYRAEALKLFPERLTLCRQRFANIPEDPPLTVRKMRAKWGSCSNDGEICLNSFLMQKPLAAIDFVVTHELCHLRHFAHNKSFYRLMDRTMPDWREREKLLVRGDVTLQLDLF